MAYSSLHFVSLHFPTPINRRGADKSLARTTSRSRRTESWKTAGFRLNQQLSNWASHVSGLGPSFMKIWTCGRSPRGSCSYTTMPRLRGHLQPIRNWPTWASSVLITHPILRIWPRRTTACSQLKGRNFLSDAEVIAAVEAWLDGQPSDFFLSDSQKLGQRAKKFIELRGECVE
jgi:hypothetical protein